MDASKVKNFVIMLLALINVFLLSIVVFDSVEAKRASDSAIESMYEILSINGISVSAEIKPSDITPQVFTITRNLSIEKKLAQEIVGSDAPIDQGGNILVYDGDTGKAIFRSGGDFQMTFDSGKQPANKSLDSSLVNFLNSIGAKIPEPALTEAMNGNTDEITVTCEWKSLPVFNCSIRLIYENGLLCAVEGRRLLDEAQAEQVNSMKFANIILLFIEARRNSGTMCSELRSAKLGYTQDITIYGNGKLIPVWEFLTDAGTYYINGITGEVAIVNG